MFYIAPNILDSQSALEELRASGRYCTHDCPEGQEIPPFGAMLTTVALSNMMNEEMGFNTQYKIVIEQNNSTNKILVVKPIFPTNKNAKSCNLGLGKDEQEVCTSTEAEPT